MRNPINIDTFVALKKSNGKLTHFMRDEGDTEWREWKHEYGYPQEFHALMFKNGAIWKKDEQS